MQNVNVHVEYESDNSSIESSLEIQNLLMHDSFSQQSDFLSRSRPQMVPATQEMVQRSERRKRSRQPQQQGQEEGWKLKRDNQVNPSILNLSRQPFRAGGVSLCFDKWKEITSNYKILSTVKGLKLDFFKKPVQYKLPHEIKFSEKEAILVDLELQKLLSKGVITRTHINPGDFVSNFFTRPKKDKNKVRCLLNLKQVNKFCRKNHFKMENLQTAVNILRPGMKMATLDVVDSFYAIRVRNKDKKFLKFITRGQVFQFEVMPQGFQDSSYIFTMLMKVPLSYIRQKFGFLSVAYIDDIILFGFDSEELLENLTITSNLLQDLGYGLNVEKSQTNPATQREFLGFILDSIEMSVSLTRERTSTMLKFLKLMASKHIVTIRQFARMIGLMIAATPAVYFGPLHTKSLEISKDFALRKNHRNFNRNMTISDIDKQDIQWWIDILPTTKTFITKRKIEHTFYTDASTSGGWGFYWVEQDLKIGQQWSAREKKLHINILELTAIYFCILSCLKSTFHSAILIFTDNTTCVHALRAQGSMRSFSCNKLVKKILFFCEDHDIHIDVTHVPGVQNEIADSASRLFKNPDTEWGIQKQLFLHICKVLGTPSIDMFASRLNTKLDKYCSWQKDPGAFHVDCFTLDWSQFSFIYCFPPFSLISRTLKTLEETTSNTVALCVIPQWQGQPWWPHVLRLLIDFPLAIPVRKNTLFLSHQPDLVHKRHKTIKLIAVKLSKNPSLRREFQKTLQSLCWRRGQRILMLSTSRIFRNGLNIRSKWGSIPINQSLVV